MFRQLGAIVPVIGKWKVIITRIDGESRQIDIDQDATVRKLYTTARRILKPQWDYKNSFQLYINRSTPLVKDDRKICNAGLYNGVTLFVEAQTTPYTWDLFVKLGNHGSPKKVTIDENKTQKELYEKVKEDIHGGTTHPVCIKDATGDEIKNDNTKLCDADCMYDGATFVSEIRSAWSLMVLHQGGRGGSQTLSVTVPANCTVREVFQEVKKKINVGDEMILNTGTKVLNNETMDSRIQSVGLSHGSSVIVVMRTRGGNLNNKLDS